MYFIKNQILKNVINFTKKNILIICTISILISLFSSFLEYKIYPTLHKNNIFSSHNINKKESLENIVTKTNIKQKKIFIIMSLLKTFIYFIGNTLLLSSIIILIRYFSEKKKNSILFYIKKIIYIFPNIFILNLFINVIIQISFFIFFLLGIFFFILFSLTPIIFLIHRKNMFDSFVCSSQIVLKNFRIISIPILIVLFCKLLILISMHSYIFLSVYSIITVSHIFINLISSILIIYLFRICMIKYRK